METDRLREKASEFFRAAVIPAALLLAFAASAGCSAFYSSAASRFADRLSYAFENNTDVSVVEEGSPAYLIMMDALIRDDPENPSIMASAAGLNAAYAELFVKDEARSKAFLDKAMALAMESACLRKESFCRIREVQFAEFEKTVADCGSADADVLFVAGSVWAGWIQANRKDWNAVAELSRVEAIMRRVCELDPHYERGRPFVYLGVLGASLPPALGGHPEEARRHFERALEISEGRDLYAKVLFAEKYARLVFDQELHDALLRETLDADPVAEGFTLSNLVAKKRAESLLASSDEYF